MSEVFRAERDCLAGLGLLASTHIRFDPELKTRGAASHAYGFNVHCLVVDNADGEVLALERNRIHADNNPLQHAEQVGIRAAMARLHAKRPREVGTPVEQYYRNSLFMAPGTAPEDFINRGCTLYNTFDPCGMCAVTLLVCYMKRIAYLFDNPQFATVYDDMRKYFRGRDSMKEPLALLEDGDDTPLRKGSRLIRVMREKVKHLEESGTPLMTTVDRCRDELQQAAVLLIETEIDHLSTSGEERERNVRTLHGIKRLCNIN
jgi:tRNA(Arg) A34 adenosine deaminase TadA